LTAYNSNSLNVLKQSIKPIPVDDFTNTFEEIDKFDLKLQNKKKVNRFPGQRLGIYQQSQDSTTRLLRQVFTLSSED